MSSSDQSSRRRQHNQRRPSTIEELSQRALDNLYDESKPLKHFLRIAEKYRKDAREFYSKGDLENAFIHFARAATLVLDKLPAHREYYTLLTPTQRSNLNLNGSDILEELGNLKRKLSKRYEEWSRDHPEAEQPDPSGLSSIPEQYNDVDLSLRRTRSKGKEKGRQGQNRRIHEDYAIWQHDDYDVDDVDELAERERRRSREQGSNRDRGVFVTSQQDSPSTRQAKKDTVSAARQAASVPQRTQTPDYMFTRPPLRSQNGQAYVLGASDGPEVNDDRRRYAELERQYQYEQQQKAMRHREEEITRRKEESRRRKEEEEGILRRQREAEEAARAARSDHQTTLNNSGPRGSVLSAQDSFSSIASGSSMASVASSTLFPPSASSSTVTTPSSFYQNPAASASAVGQKSSPPYYTQGSSSTQTTPPSISPYYALGQARPSPSPFSSSYGPAPSSAPARISPSPSSSQYAPGSSSSQAMMAPPPSSSYYAHGSSSTQVIMPPTSSSYYTPPSSSSQAPAPQPSNRNLGSSLTTVVYANPSRGSNPLPAPPVISGSSSGSSRQEPGLQAPPAQRPDQPPSFVEGQSGPTMLPIEPERFEADSTDSESVQSVNPYRDDRQHPYPSGSIDRNDDNRTPTRRRTRSPSPFTTTSPPPTEKPRAIDQLMSQHQKTQGYYPSTNSMFSGPSNPISYPSYPFGRGPPSAPPYGAPSEMLYTQRTSGSVSYPYQSAPSGPSSQLRPNYPGSRQGVTPVPLPTPPVFSAIPATAPVIPVPSPSRPSPHHSPHSKETGSLKTVTLPKDCLPKFLGIAKVNTAMNRETCGLLLGKDKGNKYAVTTLLIPKQHSTSDTCTMDEEELVLQFTEERSLITLGWIHTHPSQSCFMSSVDLHTHSGFQRMLPESFAVVCAPKSRPNFGIFRLTDPPGLKAILDCKAKDAFHPHPDLPIYTDADRGHVQMREGAPLEIVDLR